MLSWFDKKRNNSARHAQEMSKMRSRRYSIAITNSWDVALTTAAGRGFGLAVATGLLFLMTFVGCAAEAETTGNTTLEEPRAADGSILAGGDPNELDRLTGSLDVKNLGISKASPAVAQNNLKADIGKLTQLSTAEAVDMIKSINPPQNTTVLVTLPKVSTTEMTEIGENLAMHLESEFGYTPAPDVVGEALPAPSARIIGGQTLSRPVDDGVAVLRFGYRRFVSQPPKLWILGVVVSNDGKLSANPDLKAVEPQVITLVASLNEMRANLTVRDLERKLIQLSYVDAKTALDVLKGLGVTTVAKAAEVPTKIDFAALPLVVEIADPDSQFTGLVGAKTTTSVVGSMLSMEPGAASQLSENAIASPMTQLLVIFHPAHPDQFSEVRQAVDTLIDRPARQIYIEAMVLEISEDGLRELGIEWDFDKTPLTINAGPAWPPGNSTDTLDVTFDSFSIHDIFDGEFDWDAWEARIRALIRTKKAEILSRPSVLTLNNRQSTIRVGRDVPIASSREGLSGFSNKVSFDFDYLPTGILLNIRPRINESGSEVSMLIDTIVSAEVPGEQLQIRATDGETVLAEAPTISTRRVQTYGRIPNNTPLIIGGLVARDKTLTQEKIPLLGDIPLIGILFRGERKDNSKREVIIVLTPHVLPEAREARRSYPQDEDYFDSFGDELFRDSYRIRSEDVFDLSFLLENRRIVNYRKMARQAAQKNFRLAETEPFRSFVRDEIPGESILVTRMIYEVIKRLNTADNIEQSQIIYFGNPKVGRYDVKWLEALVVDENTAIMKDFGDKALAITFDYDRESLEVGRLGTEPIPDIRLIDCPNRDVWKEKLWELNQPTPEGQMRHTILIQEQDDVVRLRRALALKKVAALNGAIDQMRLTNFRVGKTLLMPKLKQGQLHVVDAETARFFFHTELYYAATLAEVEKQLKELDKMLRRPEINVLLDSGPLVGKPAGNGGALKGE